MATLIFKNTNESTALDVADLGISLEAEQEMDLISNFRDEDIIESTDISTALSGDGEVWLNDTTELTYAQLIEYLTKLSEYSTIDYSYITAKDSTTDITAAELEALTDGSESALHIHDGRYYTETELQTSGQSSIHWDNITNAPQFGDLSWKDSVDRTDSSYGSGSVLPVTGNTINDARLVTDDGDGKPAQYVCVATTGLWDAQWKKIADIDWGTASYIGVTATGNLAADDVQEALEELQGDIDTINTTLGSYDLDDAYNQGSTITVDSSIVDWQLSDTKSFKITSDSGATNVLLVSAASGGDSVTINGSIDFNGGTVAIDGVGNSNLSITSGDLTLSTITTGDVIISSVDDLTFNDQYLTAAISLSESGTAALNGGFTATSIIGAINELYGSAGSVDVLDDAYDGEAGSGAGRTITVDSGAVKLDATSGTYAPLELTQQSSAPSSGLAAGQLTFIDGELYGYDGTRSKWLSVGTTHYEWSDNSADGKILPIGKALDGGLGYRIPQNATIIKITVFSASGLATKGFQLRKNGTSTSLKTFALASNVYTSTNDSIDLTAGDVLQVYVSGTGTAVQDVVVSVYLKWKK